MPKLTSEEVTLLLVAFTSAFLMFIVGYIWSKSSVWRWIDVLYYPIGIVGILLLFVANDNLRKSVRLEEDKDHAAQQLAEYESHKPTINPGFLSIVLLHAHYDLAISLSHLSDACLASASLDNKCMAAREVGPSLKKGLDIYSWPRNDDKEGVLKSYGKYCDSLPIIMQNLGNNVGILSSVVPKFKDLYNEAAEKRLTLMQTDVTDEYVDKFKASFDDIKKIYENITISDKISMKELFTEEINDIGLIFSAFTLCLRVPEEVKQGRRILIYEATSKDLKNEVMNIERQISETTKYNVERLSWVEFSNIIWPYVLSLALALKCGKASSTISREDWLGLVSTPLGFCHRIFYLLISRLKKATSNTDTQD
jgi:hypothetical protein